jgi:hypothetical protein
MRLAGCSIARRPSKIPGTALVLREDIEALSSQIGRLLRAFELLDAAGRVELIRLAEKLA